MVKISKIKCTCCGDYSKCLKMSNSVFLSGEANIPSVKTYIINPIDFPTIRQLSLLKILQTLSV